MSPVPAPFPDPDEGRALHRRLREGDPTAFSDLAAAYLDPLIAWLIPLHPRLDPHCCYQAAADALLALHRNPASYDPARQTLDVYLRLSAQGDLRNALRAEQRHHQKRRPWEAVELSPDAGKYLGREEDPSLPLRIAEEEQAFRKAIPPAVDARLTETEACVLDLMRRGERKTAVFAAVLGLTHLPADQQAREVKRVKDRLKKRLQRAGGGDEPVS